MVDGGTAAEVGLGRLHRVHRFRQVYRLAVPELTPDWTEISNAVGGKARVPAEITRVKLVCSQKVAFFAFECTYVKLIALILAD